MRRALRIIIPVVMIGVGAVTVAIGGLRAAIALIPILAVHVVVALVVYPLWKYYRRRRKMTRGEDEH